MGALAPMSLLGIAQEGVGMIQTLAGNDRQTRRQRGSEDLALKQLQERQALLQEQAAQDVAIQRQNIATQAAIDEENRRKALKRAVARQRAQFGASGIAQGTGSSEAVLLGLFEETEDELSQRERLDSLRHNALDLGLSQKSALNVLQREQLRETQRVQRIGRPSVVNRAINFGTGLRPLGERLL